MSLLVINRPNSKRPRSKQYVELHRMMAEEVSLERDHPKYNPPYWLKD